MMVSYWLVLLACLLCTSPICAISAASLAANEVFVADPVNFYQALQTDGVDRIVVIQNLVLTNDSGLLPVTLDHNVTITGIGNPALGTAGPIDFNGSATLDFAYVYPTIHILSGVSLHLENLVTKGNIPRYGQAATQAAATYPRPLGLDLWPAILPDVNSEIVLTNVLSYSYAISNCTETALRSLVLNYDFVFGPGTQAGYRPETNSTYLLGEHDMPIIIRGTDGTTIGTMTLVANGVSWGCLEDPNEPPSAALSPDVTMDPNGFLNGSVAAAGTPPAATSSSEGGGLSTGAVVGISVAAAVGVAVALVVGFMTFRTLQRRKRMGAIYMVPSSSTPSTPKKDSPSIGIMLPMGPVDTLNKNHQEMAVASALRVRFGSLEGLELGQLIGRGAHGRIYKGSMRGAPVAVKVVEHSVESGRGLAPQGVTTEALLLTALAHPNILRVHRVASIKLQGGLAAGSRSSLESGDGLGSRGRGESSTPLPSPTTLASGDGSSPPQPSSPRDPSGEAPHGKMDGNQGASPRVSTSSPSKGVVSGKTVSSFLTNSDTGAMYSARSDPPSSILGISGAGLYETWLILEYCEKGSLHDAIQKKRAFLFKDGRPAPRAVLKILIDVAEGMQFLHSAQVLHGDLKPANVLLKSGPGSHVVTAVVADFGLSRMLDASLSQNSIQRTSSMGTIQYMAPELLSHGRLSKAADVWAFGILMVELWSGDTVFGDMSAAAIYFSLVQNGEVPKVPGHCPPRYAAAVARCLAIDPEARWDFGSIVEELRGMGGDVGLA